MSTALNRKLSEMTKRPTTASTFRTETVFVTSEIADKILKETNVLERQRKISSRNLERFTELAKTGQWLDGEQIRIADVNGRHYLVDGQHRLTVVRETGIPQWFDIKYIRCNSLEDVGVLYGMLDRNGKTRTFSEVAIGQGLHEKYGLAPSFFSAIATAAMYIENNFPASPKVTLDREKIQHAEKWITEGVIFYDLLQGASTAIRSKLVTCGMMSVALATLRYEEKKAEEFWRSIALDDALPRHSPEKVLVNFMNEHRRGEFGRSRQQIVSVGTFAAATTRCWNHYFEGTKVLKLLRIKGDIQIAGTPYVIRDTNKA